MPHALPAVPAAILADLHRRHGEPQRHYHDWSHITALLAHFKSLAGAFECPQAVELAILFHDAIYDPQAHDNEVQSAVLLRQVMAGQADDAVLGRAERMVLATARHLIPEGLPADETADMALFLDMDLAILGAGAGQFDQYEAGVRREYAHVSDSAFAVGRAAVLERFIARDALYFSAWGKARFEAAARTNIATSLARLRGT